MALRTNDGEVRGTLLLDYDSLRNPSLTPFIRRANALTDRVVVVAAASGRGTLTAGELLEIETLLAAHFYQASDPAYQSKSTTSSSATFLGSAGMRLERTRYGQDAMLMDWTGSLDALNKRAFAGADWLGKPVSEQIDYKDRD